MKFLAIIPSRFASTRFPGKPLAMLGGKTIVERVYERVSSVFQHLCVATDDERILATVQSFGGKAVMTSTSHKSGTDRCREALEVCEREMNEKFDVVVNVQGDEPFIDPQQLEMIKACFNDPATDIATLIMPFKPSATWEELKNPNVPKVVIDDKGFALYFSRSVIPYRRDVPESDWAKDYVYYKHIGLYAYQSEILRKVSDMPIGKLEKCESLEQLRWLEAGLKIKTCVTNIATIGIDTPADLEHAQQYIKNQR